MKRVEYLKYIGEMSEKEYTVNVLKSFYLKPETPSDFFSELKIESIEQAEDRDGALSKYEMTIKNNQMFIRFHTGPVFEPKLFKNSLVSLL